MASHEELIAEMPKLEKLSNAQRLKHAKKRRQKQLKKWQETERGLRQSVAQSVVINDPSIRRSTRQRLVNFDEDAMLRDAINRNDAEEVRYYLESEVDPNISNADGLSSLHMCCIEDGSDDLAALLVEFKADLESRDIEGWTPLHAAANCGNLKMINFLLDQGASLVAINHDDKMPIDVAADSDIRYVLQQKMTEAGYTEDVLGYIRASVAKTMLADLKDSVRSERTLDIKDKYGTTAAHIAAANGYLEVLQFLIDHKANLNIQDNEGWTPVHAAVLWNQPKAILMLAKHGADVSIHNIRDETPFAISELPDIRQLLVDLQSGVHPDELEAALTEADSEAATSNRKTRSMSVRRASQRDKDGMQRSDSHKEAEMRRASLTQMDEGSQQALQVLQDSAEAPGSPGVEITSSMLLDDDDDEQDKQTPKSPEETTTTEEENQTAQDNKADNDEAVTSDTQPTPASNDDQVKIRSPDREDDNRERPKSVLKKTDYTPPVLTTTTTTTTTNAHTDRECCIIL
ncbi:protein phosphatase 1 regulatory inhibitor subunit 16B-like [Dysidea avara]|uniref:protein phosphatase 1 regulatory inhibitor subunit 16B-like n=1 Tax=Dysidea avara TaxID=196820 RepID=UPI00332B67E0